MRYVVRPISDRTPFTGKHDPSPFKASWSDTLEVLGRELDQLAARDVVLELDVTEGDIRLDGMVRANAKVASPAVRIAFDSKHGPLTYASDRFISPSYRRTLTDWQHNVRAIALGLEALRKVDRYGITKRGEQYAGWKALPAGAGETASHMTREEALGVLGVWGRARYDLPAIPAEFVNTDPGSLRSLHRAARRAAHPDRNNGDQTAWDKVEQAAKVLGVLS